MAHNESPAPTFKQVDSLSGRLPLAPASPTYVPTLSIQMVERQAFILLTLQGELELETVPMCRHYFHLALKTSDAVLVRESKPIIVDLSRCSFVDSQGIQLFINTERAARERDSKIIFASLTTRLLYVLHRTRLFKFLNTAETKESAIEMVLSGQLHLK